MFKEMLQYALDMKRYGTVAWEVPQTRQEPEIQVVTWMRGMEYYFSDSLASLVDHELRHRAPASRAALLSMLRDRLPADAQAEQEALALRWEARGLEGAFWQGRVGDVMTELLAEAQHVLSKTTAPSYPQLKLELVQFVVLRFAERAHDEATVRTRMGLRGDFPRKPRQGRAVGEGIRVSSRR